MVWGFTEGKDIQRSEKPFSKPSKLHTILWALSGHYPGIIRALSGHYPGIIRQGVWARSRLACGRCHGGAKHCAHLVHTLCTLCTPNTCLLSLASRVSLMFRIFCPCVKVHVFRKSRFLLFHSECMIFCSAVPQGTPPKVATALQM